MSANNTIEHLGVVSDIEGTVVKVKIESNTACSSCHAKKACLVANKVDKIIEINTEFTDRFKLNEKVKICLKSSDGFKALFFGYIAPLIIVVLSLLIFTNIGFDEIKAGIISLIILIPYYIILYLFKTQLKNKFTFELKKLLKIYNE